MNRPVQYLNSLFQSDENAVKFHETFSEFFPAIVYVYDVSSKNITYLNTRVVDLLGFTLDDFNNASDVLAALIFRDDIDKASNEIQKLHFLKDNETHTFDVRMNHARESWKIFRTVGRVFRRDAEGNPLSLLFVAQDVTEQLRREDELAAKQQVFEATEKLLLMGSWSWNPLTSEMTWSDGIYEILEFDRKEIIGDLHEFYKQHIVPEHIEAYQNAMQMILKDRASFEVEYVLLTKSGREKFVYTKGEVVLDPNGNLKRIIGITRDITTKKNLEKVRERTIRELNRSNKELEEFAYVASHDMHEPIRKILTFCERLKTKHRASLGDDGSMYLDRISGSADNMRALIDNLLEFSRVTKGNRSFVECDLTTVINNVLADQELRIEETGTEVRLKNLPVVQCVVPEMRQLFNNLIGNALKFQRQGVPPVITIGCKRLTHREKSEHLLPFDQAFFQINIQDNGIGFEQKYGEKIFEIFQRLHGKAEYSGTGIGLSICKKIVENHEGIIFATGEPGAGSVFSIILPERQSE